MTTIWNTLVRLSLGGGAFALLLLLIWPAARRFPARWRKAAAIGALLFFVIPFTLPLPIAVSYRAQAAAPPPVIAVLPAAAPVAHTVTAPTILDVRVPLLLAWLSGAALIGALRLISFSRFSSAVKRSAGPAGDQADALCLSLSKDLALSHPPALFRCGELGAPMVLGIIRPRIFLPYDLPEETLRLVLLHELTHCKSRDTWWKAAALSVSVLHWWNPLAYLPAYLLEAECELACDERVALSMDGPQRKQYGAAILELASRRPAAHCAPFSRKRLLKGRLKTILRAKPCSRGVKAAGAALAASLAGAGLLASSVITMAVAPSYSIAVIGGADGPTSILVAGGSGEKPAPAARTTLDSLPVPGTPDETGDEPFSRLLPDFPEQAADSGGAPIADSSAPIADSSAPAGSAAGDAAFVLSSPVPGAQPSVGFWGYSHHTGMDLPASSGTPILAAAEGVVRMVKYDDHAYGYHLFIDHGNGYETLYAQCSQIFVNEGETIRRGQQIAAVGQTGNSTGPHCHFEVRAGGEPVDPAPYMEDGA